MFGAVLMKPIHKEADLGVVFMDGGGYLNMCGHGSIGVATLAVIRGLVPVTEPYTNVSLEAPAGLIRTRVKVENGRVKEASIVNVPAFLYRKDVDIHVPGCGEIRLDIAFGGNFSHW
ncbi:proline racemase [Sporolactobacillus inulinus]|uniref:Proline racemase n=2 Tax=Sporolactobacillus inulinus TaxID=2078 RepID=A0A4Y1ZGN6_9BACL|nr:proline racemase [Sporolactobacillus inulinus]